MVFHISIGDTNGGCLTVKIWAFRVELSCMALIIELERDNHSEEKTSSKVIHR